MNEDRNTTPAGEIGGGPRGLSARLRHLSWVRGLMFFVVVVLAIGTWTGHIDMAVVHRYAERLNGALAFGFLVVLPLLGFPVSVLHVAAGIRFGGMLGMLLVCLSIGIQLLASYWLVKVSGESFARRFDGLRRRIPRGAHPSLCVFAVLLPGAPYVAINYVLPLVGVRLRTYLLCCWPLHTLRSTVTVLLGDQTDHFTPARLIVLGVYALLLTAGSWWLLRRLRRQLGDPQPEEGDRMQPV